MLPDWVCGLLAGAVIATAIFGAPYLLIIVLDWKGRPPLAAMALGIMCGAALGATLMTPEPPLSPERVALDLKMLRLRLHESAYLAPGGAPAGSAP